MRLQRISSGFFAMVLLVLGGNALLLVRITQSYDAVVAAQEHRRQALTLSSDLQRETEQLARMVRAYTATGESRYLLYYYDILATRQGEKAPPAAAVASAYWDEVVAGRRQHQPRGDGSGRPLAERLRALGFGDAELAALQRVLEVTASMNEVEQKAFAATQGLYDPDTGRYVPDGAIRLDYATDLVHSAAYNALKADLSEAVDTLFRLLDQRTGEQVAGADRALSRYLVLSLAAMALTILLAMLALRGLRRNALQPIARLGRATDRLAAGDYSTRVGALAGFEELDALGRTVDTMAGAIEDDIARRRASGLELEAARREAVEATRAKSRFLAHMSHEIRTPMNAILGMAYLVRRSGLDARQREHVDAIHAAGRSLLAVVNDLLDLSKVESGRLELAHSVFRIEDVAGHALQLVRQQAADKGLELVFALGDRRLVGGAGAFVGDPMRLGQVLTNLLANAVRFTHRGRVVLGLACETWRPAEVVLRIDVRDTGIGLSEAQAARLFEDFAQADEATAQAYGGTGLGLAIARRIVEHMGGRIGVDSAQGQGTHFHATVRLEPAPEAGAPMVDPLPWRRVLVVDPDASARSALVDLLAALDAGAPPVTIVGVAGLAQAQAAWADAQARGAPFDGLLLDPACADDPAQALAALGQGADRMAPSQLILVSMQPWAPWRAAADAAGVRAVLAKPVLPGPLHAALARPAAAPPPGRVDVPLPAEAHGLAGRRVLLVEDQPVNREVASEILRAAGIDVACAENGQAALDHLRTARVDAVLLDLQMPVMDGYALAQRLRADPQWDATPIVALSAHAMAGDRERCLALGMQAHLAKPVDPQALFACLRALLQPAAQDTTPSEIVEPAGTGTGTGTDAPTLDTLLQALRSGDSEARGLWQRWRARAAVPPPAPLCAAVDAALAAFDFDTAADHLERALASRR